MAGARVMAAGDLSQATQAEPARIWGGNQPGGEVTSSNADAVVFGLAGHGAGRLSAVDIDGYNAELRDDDGFIGDRASGRAFRAMLEDVRASVRNASGHDPLGSLASAEISKRKLDRFIRDGDPVVAGVVLGTIEAFAQEFAAVTRRILRLREWRGTQRIVVGGGFRDSRIGKLAIGRAAGLLRATNHDVELQPITPTRPA